MGVFSSGAIVQRSETADVPNTCDGEFASNVRVHTQVGRRSVTYGEGPQCNRKTVRPPQSISAESPPTVRKEDRSTLLPTEMLAAQARRLDRLFAELVDVSTTMSACKYVDAADRYMRLALKAQAQCRSTVEALTGFMKSS